MMIRAVAGSSSTNGCICSTSTGCSDSMPSTAIPFAILSSMSTAPGSSVRAWAARERTSSLSSISRHGGAYRCPTSSSERWSATAKERISSTSSPKNSTRNGESEVGGKTSMIPPRTANCPRASIMSTRS